MTVARSPRRVAFVIPGLGIGGAERVFVTLLRHLSRARVEPHLIAFHDGPLARDLPADVQTHIVGVPRLRYGVWRLLRLLRRLSPDVLVTTQGYLNAVLLVCRRWLLPTRLVVREVIGEQYLEGSSFRAPFYTLYLRWCRAADRVVFQSDGALREVLAREPTLRDKAVRIHNPVDFDAIAAFTAGKQSPYHSAGFQIVSAGRLTRQKGFDVLLRAVALLVEEGLRLSLTVLGEGSERKSLERLARDLGVEDRVTWRGIEANPFPFFAHADVFVLASRYEGFPNALLEALACGCAVVATTCRHGPAEMVRDGVNGTLVPPEDPVALARAIRALVADPPRCKRLGAADSVRRFAVQEIVAEWEELFDQLDR